MERFQFWIFLTLAVAFGVGLKALSGAEEIRTGSLKRFLDDGRQAYLPNVSHKTVLFDGKKKAPVQQEEKVAGLEAAPATPKVSPSPSPTPKPADKKKDDKKKKKKKKKIKGAGESVEVQGTPVEETPEKKDEPGPVGGGSVGDGGVTAAGGLIAPANDGLPHTAQEWKAYLLPSADFERTSRFIRFFQTGVVTADIYYDVVNEMTADPRPEMRRLGVMALDSTPQLRSFTMLALMEKNESTKSKVRPQIGAALRKYARIEYVKVLGAAMLVADNPTLNLRALQIFKLALEAQKGNAALIAAQSQTPTPPTGPTAQRTPAALQIMRFLSSYRPVLLQIVAKNADASVRQSAAEARTALEDLLTPTLPS